MRSIYALGAGAGVLLVVTALVLGTTTANFSDRVVADGMWGAATLPAPTAVAAALRPDLASVEVSWDSAPGDFAESWELVRREGTCAGWIPPEDGVVIIGPTATPPPTSPSTDETVLKGQTYCYSVGGLFADHWASYSTVSSSTEVYIPLSVTLHPSQSGASRTLQTTSGTGSYRFGCALLGGLGDLVCVGGRNDPWVTFTSSGQYRVPASAVWEASLRMQSTGIGVGALTVKVDVWHAASPPCQQSVPADGSLLASGQKTINVVVDYDDIVAIDLIPSGASPPNGNRTICMRVEASGPALVGLLFSIDLLNGSATWLDGAVEGTP